MKTTHFNFRPLLLGGVLTLAACLSAGAANIIKANNSTLLNDGASWGGGTPPGSGDIAQWDSTVTAANSVGLGAPTTWGGILVSNTGGLVTITNDGNALTVGSSGIDLSWTNNSLTLQCPLVVSASQTWAVTNSKTLTITNTVSESGSGLTLTKAGNGTVTVNGSFNFTDNLTVNAGTFNVNNTFNNNVGTLSLGGGTLNINGAFTDTPTLALTTGTLNFGTNTVTLTNNNISIAAAATLGATGGGTVILQPAASQSWSVGLVNAAINSTMIFNGDPTSTINITAANGSGGMGTAGGLFKIVNGAITSTAGRGWKDNILMQNGSLTFLTGADRFSMSTTNQTFTMTNGTITVPGTAANGFRVGNDNGGNQTGNTAITATQSGGTINVLKGGISVSMSIGGSTTNTANASYTLSGGLLNVIGAGSDGCLTIGACLIGGNSTAFNLFGGKLLVSGANSGVNTSIFGYQGYTNGVTSPQQIFYWTNGTLVCGSFQPTNLLSSPTGVYGTLVNNGSGTLAPGDVGLVGKTTVYGSFSNATTAGTLAVDIAGTTKATAFQNSGAFYDTVDVKSTAFVRGALIVNLTNGFTPASSDTFTILTTGANGLNASFNNVDINSHVPVVGVPGASFLVTTNGNSVILSLYGTLAASFTVSSFTPPANSPVTFTDNSTGSITNRHWNLGDGTVFDTNSTSFAYSYATSGSKTAVLTVSAVDGSTSSYTNTIVVAATALDWKGDGVANVWNFSALNWLSGVTPVAYADNADLVINDNGSNSPAINLTVTVQPKTTIFNNSTKAYTMSGAGKISGTNTLTKLGGSSLTIINTNDYSGGTTITGGSLQLGNGTAMGRIAGGIVDNASLVIAQPSGTTTVTNSVSGSGTLTVNGSGIVTLLGANSYASNTIITAGTLKMDATSPLPSGTGKGDVVINGTLDIANANPTLDAISGSGTITTTDAGFNTVTVGANNNSTIFSGSINNGSGTVALNTSGSGTLSLTANSTFTGDVQLLTGSTVWISSSGALGNGPKTIWITNASPQLHLNGTNGNITLPSNYTLLTSRATAPGPVVNEAGNNVVNSRLHLTYGAGGSMVTVNGGTLTLAGGVSASDAVVGDNRVLELSGAGNGTISGTITNNTPVSGTLNIRKSGAGTWTLSNANNDYGFTAVTAGRLLVSGAINSASGVVGSGGLLGGTGSIANSVTVTNVAVEGGDHLNLVYGTLAMGSDLNLKQGATCSFRLGTTAAGSNDKITVAGNLLINNTNSVVISASTLETTNDYVLMTVAGTITGAFNTNVTWSGTPPTGSGNYSVVTTANEVKLHYTATAPSPASITVTTSGSSLVLNWPNGQGWRLEAQTNSLSTGLNSNWGNVSGATPPFTNSLNAANGTVFYRLVWP